MAIDSGEKTYMSHTAQEIDDAVDAVASKASAADLTAEVTAREKTDAALAGQIDTGAKNRLTINSGSSTPPTRWINIPVSVEAGKYRVYFGNLMSDDTDAEICQACFLDGSNQQTSNWMSFSRSAAVSASATLTAAATTLRLYASDSYAHSEGDVVSFVDGMVCKEAEWEISQTYVPYCPTMPELYQMILDLGGGSRAAAVQLAPAGEEEQR